MVKYLIVMKVMQNATCVALFCRCKMLRYCSEVMVGKMISSHEPKELLNVKGGQDLLLTHLALLSIPAPKGQGIKRVGVGLVHLPTLGGKTVSPDSFGLKRYVY
jgi:hypothetical protein